MTTITKERIELFIKNPLENGLTRGEQMELARIAMASLDAEPVAWECGENIILFNPDTVEAYAKRAEISPKPLFAAPPAPVVPDEWTIHDAVKFCRETGRQDAGSAMEAWNACRAAMLQGVEPVSQTYKLNELSGNSPVTPNGWISCSEQMPEDEQEVIVHNKLGYRYVSYFDEHSGLFFDMRGGNQMNCIEHILVTHWMPLQAAPQQ
ncbi:DUF551 domain-containing protein [Salmonella enterica subsp. enterica]|nr:DUF551 domain-containing protein [Salmonella enterica subsp. enterica]MIH32216.1 DUF551 domain-containing protein [Salmonella enterica subsp. enterica]